MAVDRVALDFGTKLREARERRGVSLRTIADATKISVAVLEALERNDFSRLPGGIFSRAFVRSYAIEVGLDPEATIQEFVASFPEDSVTAGHATSVLADRDENLESDSRVVKSLVRLVAVIVPLVGVVLYFATGARRFWSPSSAPRPPVEAVDDKPAGAPPAPSANATTAASDPAAVKSASPTETAPTSGPAAPQILQVALSARRPCWVSATVDGRKTIEQLLQVGEERTLDIQREMVLTVGDASAIALKLNGAAARPLGKSGEVVTVRLNPKNFKDYLSNR
jgi:cytoskeletal protein RodZ